MSDKITDIEKHPERQKLRRDIETSAVEFSVLARQYREQSAMLGEAINILHLAAPDLVSSRNPYAGSVCGALRILKGLAHSHNEPGEIVEGWEEVWQSAFKKDGKKPPEKGQSPPDQSA